MGWTYRIDALPKGISAKEWVSTKGYKSLSPLTLVDDDVFDREGLAHWMGAKEEDWLDDWCLPVSKEMVERAIGVLRELQDKVAKMPFKEDSEVDIWWNPKTDAYEYEGEPENIAIVKEVRKVLCREYHFRYPWECKGDKNEDKGGVIWMIRELEKVQRFMAENPDTAVIAVYY